MPITRDEANALAELVCVVRPAWNTRGVIERGLRPLASHPANLSVIAWAALRAAADPQNVTPAVIPLNGPHWNLDDRPIEPRLTPEHECQRHPGKWAGNCPLCHSERIAVTDPDEKTEVLSTATAQERARAAARRAKHALAPEADETPTKPADVTDDPPWDINGPDVAAHRTLEPENTPEPVHEPAPVTATPDPEPEPEPTPEPEPADPCWTILWDYCRSGKAHPFARCTQPRGHHDAHTDGAHTWDRTQPAPDIDWCTCTPGSELPPPGPRRASGPGGRFTSADLDHGKVRKAMTEAAEIRRAGEVPKPATDDVPSDDTP